MVTSAVWHSSRLETREVHVRRLIVITRVNKVRDEVLRMESVASSVKVSFSDSQEVYDLGPYGEEGSSEEEEFVEYTSRESEMFSIDDENDLELIEQAMKCAYTSSRSTVQRAWVPPVERESLLFFDKDLTECEDGALLQYYMLAKALSYCKNGELI